MRHYRVTFEDAVIAHNKALTYGGAAGISNEGAVHSAIARPYSGYHRRIHQKAAALLHSLVQNHGFVDGNKRTALLVTLLLIRRSGYRLDLIGDERIDDVVVSVATGDTGFDDLESWFSQRLRKDG